MEDVIVPLGLNLIFWGFILAVAVLPLYLRYRDRKNAHETVRTMIGQGRDIPPELIDRLVGGLSEPAQDALPAGLRATNIGTIIACAGAGLMMLGFILALALWFNHFVTAATIAGPMVAASGLLVVMVGLAFLVIGRRTAQLAKQVV